MKQRFTGVTFKEILDRNNGAGMGFDLLRLGLALLVMLAHGSGITGHSGTTQWITNLLNQIGIPVGDPAPIRTGPSGIMPPGLAAAVDANTDPALTTGLTGISGPFIRALVPMFFTLSGFLVTGSALRTRNLIRFLGLRTLRILPALFVEVFLSAILLGAIFTELPLSTYYTHPDFYSYFLNIIGIVHFFLPGVFPEGDGVVNANLWTIPYELECYLLMSAFIVLGLLNKRILATILFAVVTAVLVAANIKYDYMAGVVVFNGRALVFCFAVGVLFYLWRDKLVFHPILFAGSLVVSYILLRQEHTIFIAPFILAYVTMFIGLMPLPQFALLKSGDYSYGIYLYGFPVTKALVVWLGRDALPVPVMMLLAVSVTCAFAALSWHGVEKHFLKLKRYLSPRSAKVTATHQPTAVPTEMSDQDNIAGSTAMPNLEGAPLSRR